MASPVTIEELTTPRSVRALVELLDLPDHTVRVNRALAEALAFRHRVAHSLVVRAKIPPPPEDLQRSPEEKLLRSIFGEDKPSPPPDGEVVASGAYVKSRDRLIHHVESDVYFNAAADGTVESVARTADALPKGMRERITVVVAWNGPLTTGDVLWHGGRALGVVERIEDDGDSRPILRAGRAGGWLEIERRLPTAQQLVEARSIGPYSLVTQRPISGQFVRPGQIAWLAENGGRALLGEFATYKGNDPFQRTRLYENLVMGRPVADSWSEIRPAPRGPSNPLPLPSVPRPATSPEPPSANPAPKDIFTFFEKAPVDALPSEILRVVERVMRVCGFALELEGHGLRLSLRMPAGDHGWSRGEVKKPETIHYRTFRPEPGGLFCQKIFGPVKDYECACGKYKRMKHRGTVCESCGVEVLRSSVRRERFGHVALPSPVVPKHLRRIVSALIGEPAAAWTAAMDVDGGDALRARLAAVDPAARMRETAGDDRELLEDFAACGVAPPSLLWDVVPVMPPDLRPLVPLAGGMFATSDLNDLYRRVINRSNRLRRLVELDAPQIILVNERSKLRESVDQLLFNGAKGMPKVHFQNRTLRSVFRILKDFVREDPKGFRSDYSAAATALVDDRSAIVAKVPFEILYELTKPLLFHKVEAEGLSTTIKGSKAMLAGDTALARRMTAEVARTRPFLFANGLLGDEMAACDVEMSDEPVIRLPFVVAERIGVRTGSRVVVHMPVSEPGIAEAEGLARGDARRLPPGVSGWLGEITALRKGVADRMTELAVLRSVDPCETPQAAYLLGGYDLSSARR